MRRVAFFRIDQTNTRSCPRASGSSTPAPPSTSGRTHGRLPAPSSSSSITTETAVDLLVAAEPVQVACGMFAGDELDDRGSRSVRRGRGVKAKEGFEADRSVPVMTIGPGPSFRDMRSMVRVSRDLAASASSERQRVVASRRCSRGYVHACRNPDVASSRTHARAARA